MHVQMVDPERAILSEIADRRFTRDDVATTYAFALRQRAEINWAKVNREILYRWSLSGLEYIKNRAWKLVEEKAS